jgi:hypothetical protein
VISKFEFIPIESESISLVGDWAACSLLHGCTEFFPFSDHVFFRTSDHDPWSSSVFRGAGLLVPATPALRVKTPPYRPLPIGTRRRVEPGDTPFWRASLSRWLQVGASVPRPRSWPSWRRPWEGENSSERRASTKENGSTAQGAGYCPSNRFMAVVNSRGSCGLSLSSPFSPPARRSWKCAFAAVYYIEVRKNA